MDRNRKVTGKSEQHQKAYQHPTFTRFGDVRDVTLGTTGSKYDSNTMAAASYGD